MPHHRPASDLHRFARPSRRRARRRATRLAGHRRQDLAAGRRGRGHPYLPSSRTSLLVGTAASPWATRQRIGGHPPTTSPSSPVGTVAARKRRRRLAGRRTAGLPSLSCGRIDKRRCDRPCRPRPADPVPGRRGLERHWLPRPDGTHRRRVETGGERGHNGPRVGSTADNHSHSRSAIQAGQQCHGATHAGHETAQLAFTRQRPQVRREALFCVVAGRPRPAVLRGEENEMPKWDEISGYASLRLLSGYTAASAGLSIPIASR